MRRLILLPLLLSLLVAVSCSRGRKERDVGQEMKEHGMPSDWKFKLPEGDPVQGRTVFVELECFKCHEVKGEKFPAVAQGEKGVGAELSQMAQMHPPEFFAESIINPNAVIDPDAKEKAYLSADGKSKMPNYNDILTVKQVADLAAYLASLKGQEHKTH